MIKKLLLGCLTFMTTAVHSESYTQQLDPQTKALLDKLSTAPISINEASIPELRKQFAPPPSSLVKQPNIEKIENITIPNSSAGLRIYTPKHTQTSPLPTFVFIHGGGWALGSLDEYDSFCQEISYKANCLVVSIDYRLAPEHPFPQPLDDCYSAACWIEKHIQEYGGNPNKIAIGGDSAGANLAAAVTLMAKQNQGPKWIHQLLICPVLNCNFETLSYYEFSKDYFLTREDMQFFWKTYLKNMENGHNPYASPLKAQSLSGLPPATLIVSNFDPLRDEGLAYASRLSKEGVPTSVKQINSIHGFYRFDELDLAKEAVLFIANRLKTVFAERS